MIGRAKPVGKKGVMRGAPHLCRFAEERPRTGVVVWEIYEPLPEAEAERIMAAVAGFRAPF